MTTVPIIATIIYISALTPIEKWRAAGGQFHGNLMSGHWFIIASVVTLVTLTVLLAIISVRQMRQRQIHRNSLFDEYSKKSGLSKRESQILMNIASKAGLKQSEAIFTMASNFDRGASIMVEEILTKQQESDKSDQLKTELLLLREKLGFQ